MIGYTQYRTNLPGGRLVTESSMRACIVRGDGTGFRILAEELITRENQWTQFAGWSPDGKEALIILCWESSENAAWEDENRTYRIDESGWLVDSCLVDIETGKVSNVTAVERVSCYNTGLFFWPSNPKQLGFQGIINGESHPFIMDVDGRNKKDLAQFDGFSYGFSGSPDGKRISYHSTHSGHYGVYLADGDGRNLVEINTGNPFNFCPRWSSDGQWVLFLSGEHYNCHPYVVHRDGTSLRKLADRGGYTSVVRWIDVDHFHGDSSDVPVWSPDGKWVYYTAMIERSVELVRVSLNGQVEQLTRSAPGVLNYHPQVSPDGQWVVFGSTRDGVRQLYVIRTDRSEIYPISQLKPGWAAMWAHWQPLS